ncbi:MAG: pyridoxamine 5'-phosphate oxidase [Bacteroidetes bacterium]|nr:MAG: pyridoxamine 5'-phosphate oxidase [Bacteroidota bacterium]
MDISNMREEFLLSGLERKDLFDDPVVQFEKWFKQAQESGMIEPNAMTLATVNDSGQPSVRTVLLKFFDGEGFVFYTNYESKKAKDIAGNSKVSLLFPWLDLQRQVKINGIAEKVPTAQSIKYFLSRPRGSQLGAWTSNQSSVITTRSLLLSKFEEMKSKFQDKEVPLPSFWGGYRVVPKEIEFWQGRKNRLHDRFNYTLQDNGEWQIERLAP